MKLVKNVLLPDFKALTVQTGDVLIKDGRFAEVGGVINVPDAEVIEGGGMLMLPAMSDIHTHMVQSLTKGVLDDLNITDWLVRMLAVQSRLTDEDWYWGVLLGCLQSLRFGVTNVNEMTYFPHIDAVAQAYKDAGIRVTFGLGATDIAENDQIKVLSVEENLQQAEYIYRTYHGKGLLRTAAAPQGRPANTPELMVAMKRFANERGLIWHTHLAEGKMETERVRSWTGRGEGEELLHLGVLDEHSVLAHAIWLSDEEVKRISETGATVAHCPSTNMKISDGTPKIAQFLAAGGNVGIGGDGEASSSNRDLIREARLGSYLQKAYTLDPTVMGTADCWKMLTENGAKALGYGDLGVIRKGYLADFSLVRTDSIATTNRKRILSNLLYAGEGSAVDSVFVAGEQLLSGGEYVKHSKASVLAGAERTLEHVEQYLAEVEATL